VLSQIEIEKDFDSLADVYIGFSIEDGKAIMAHLQKTIVKQQCETYVLARRFCMDCERFRRIKGYGKRKIRTVFGCVEVRNPRILNCQRCLPHFCDASAVLRDICPDQATPELMELSARLGSLMPYRKAADHRARADDEQTSQRSLSHLRGRAEPLFSSGGMLQWREPEPSHKVATALVQIAKAGHIGCRTRD